jgi:peptidylprolyl isomerase
MSNMTRSAESRDGVRPSGRPSRWWRAPLAGLILTLGWLALVVTEAQAASKDGEAVFARVGDAVITQQAYDEAYAQAARGKFYHGKPPEAEVARLQREVGDKLVNDLLLMAEAKKRKIKPNEAEVQKQIDAYEARYAKSPMWKTGRNTLLPPLKKKLEDQSVLEQLEVAVKKVATPTDKQVEQYYEQHKDKFTEPEQVKISMILLKVDPSSPQAKWDAALEEASAISKKLRSGGNFAEVARKQSGDPSASKGGDVGYLHRGMLPEPAQQALDKMQPGAISDAVPLLEGVAVMRLDARKTPHLNPLSAVKQRASDLLQRDTGDQAWTGLIARLRRDTPPRVDESRYLPLAAPVATAKPASK